MQKKKVFQMKEGSGWRNEQLWMIYLSLSGDIYHKTSEVKNVKIWIQVNFAHNGAVSRVYQNQNISMHTLAF